MTSIADAPENPLPVVRSRSRRGRGGAIGLAARQSILLDSLDRHLPAADLLLAKATVSLVQWGYWNAIWTVPGIRPALVERYVGLAPAGQLSPRSIASFCAAHIPLISSGRPALATLTFVALFFVSSRRNWWRKDLVLVWVAALVTIGLLMWGGIFGLAYVSQDRWGGLPVTLMLATFGLAFGFPLGIVVALGRRSSYRRSARFAGFMSSSSVAFR